MSTHRQGHPRTPGTSAAPGLSTQAWRPPWATSLSASRTVAGRSATTSLYARTLDLSLVRNLIPAPPVARTLPADQRPAPGTAHEAGSPTAPSSAKVRPSVAPSAAPARR